MNQNIRILAYKFPPPRQTIRVDRLSLFEPLELEYLYSYLKDHPIELIDGMLDRRNIRRYIQRKQFNIILLTGYMIHRDAMVELALWLKKQKKRKIMVFFGGPQAEVTPSLMHCPWVDGVISSPDPRVLRLLIKRLSQGLDYCDIPGIYQQIQGEIRYIPPPPLDIKDLVIPERILFNKRPNKYYNMFYKPCASVKSSLGCNGKCSYCFCRKMNQEVFSCRKIEQLIDELESIICNNIFVLDDNFLISRQRIQNFIKSMKERKISKKLIVYGTAHFISQNEDLIEGLSQVGVCWFIVGFEYLSNKQLSAVNKKSSSYDNQKVIDICRKHSINITALFMVDPQWTVEDFKSLERYVKDNRLFFSTFSTRTSFPGADDSKVEKISELEPSWRYDLLRLHEKPHHMSVSAFYLRLFKLYMLPAITPGSCRALLKNSRFLPGVILLLKSFLTGIEFLYKLWRYP